MQQYFNPRSPHGEQRQSLDTSSYHGHISIHAPRMGSDNTTFSLSAGPIYFNPRPRMGSDIFVSSYPFGEYIISIHAPRMGSDPSSFSGFEAISLFQSTLPAWGATAGSRPQMTSFSYFNPRSPHGERPAHQSEDDDKPHISIHAPRMGSDAAIIRGKTSAFLFQSTLPAWGATSHALLIARTESSFQSTPPAWGATESFTNFRRKSIISIHAPRMGSDLMRRNKRIR